MNETTYKVLSMIIESGEDSVSGDSLGENLGISRNAINKHVNKLKSLGILIESSKRGYHYIESDTLSEYTLRQKLEKSGLDIAPFVSVCDSTNNYAKTLVCDNQNYLVAAPYQTSGKGRLKRQFSSKEGGAYTTFVFYPKNLSVMNSLNIVLLCGLAVNNVLHKFNINSTIKWPNDVLVDGRKICGILLESTLDSERISKMYLGIGINVSNDLSDISDIAVNMNELLGRKIYREDVIVSLANELVSLLNEYETNGFDSLRADYQKFSSTIGQNVTVKDGDNMVSGKAIGMSKHGYLILIDDDGKEREIVVGDILPRDLIS